MSEETPPYHAHGDDALEARIVAWVLGESSPFEAEELKRLCAERPELEIFRRRMQAVHELLGESEKQGASPAWKLNPAKRTALDAAIGAPAAALANVVVPKKRSYRIWISAAASVAILIALAGLLAPMTMRQSKPVRETPTIVTYSAMMESYETEYPPELIEGTPVPITPQRLLSQREQPRRAASQPSSAQAKVIAGTTASPTAIPVPAIDLAEPSIAFSDTDAFGSGFGADAGGGGFMADAFSAGEHTTRRSPAPSSANPRVAPGAAAASPIPSTASARSIAVEAPAEANTSIARAQEFRKTGKYDEAREIFEPFAATDENARRELESLDDPLRTNPALTYEHVQNVDKVRRNLYMAEGHYNLGKFDDAKKAYEAIIRIDPHNTAARRGMERVAARKSDYYRAAYDHTRAELLMQVDQAWELAVPTEAPPSIPSTPSIPSLSPEELAAATPQDAQSLRELAETVEERRKALASIVRTKGIIYTGEDTGARTARVEAMRDETRDQAIQRGLDAQDYTEAKAAFEADLRRLEEMQTRLRKAAAEPKAPPVVPTTETSAAADPFSTFSLNVSDAAFIIARDAIRRGERPAPEQIRAEQFYNALDYGDPAPAAGEAVATHIEQTAHPVLPGRNLVRIAARVGSTGRAATQPLHLTLLVDQSGSMVRADRQLILEKTLTTLATLLGENDVVHVIGFARQPRLIAEALPGNRASEIRALVHQSAAEGGTNMEAALELAQQIAVRHQKPGAQNRVVLLSDGAVNLGNADPTRLAERITQMRQQGIATDIAGIGSDGLNDALLAELARHGDGRYHIVTPETGDRLARDLAGAFRPAASDVKVQVVFNPERVGGWKLIGFEEHRLNTEDFRNDTVDAAELAAEEAGVAIYQVETLPQGRGEIGEVFIRFRDTTTGSIIERSWPLPYDASTPALDQARPSMQLATLAMLTAEKLRGGPLGESIDLTTHRPLIQSLTDHFRHDPAAHELFEMISVLSDR